MKFAFQTVTNSGARLGWLSELGRHEGKVIKTPSCFVYTRRGNVPHLTYDTLQHLSKDSLSLVLPLTTLAGTCEAVKQFSKGIGEFIGLQEYFLYTSVQDPAVKTPVGYNDKLGVSLWTKTGRVQLDVDKFMSIQQSFSPDVYQALCDSDTDKNSSKKRIRKSVERTLDYLDRCLDVHFRSDKLSKTAIFGTIEGGYDLDYRRKSAKLTAERLVDGFVIDGFNNYGPETETLEMEEFKDILIETLKILPSEKPRVMHSVWRPDNIIRAVDVGIDLFDASYPYILTERGCALIMPLQYSPPVKVCNSEEKSEDLLEINLREERYSDDFSVILEGCSCYACRKFSRAYIHHLLLTSEMLAQVLLMMHNLHHYVAFFDVLQDAMIKNELHALKCHVFRLCP